MIIQIAIDICGLTLISVVKKILRCSFLVLVTGRHERNISLASLFLIMLLMISCILIFSNITNRVLIFISIFLMLVIYFLIDRFMLYALCFEFGSSSFSSGCYESFYIGSKSVKYYEPLWLELAYIESAVKILVVIHPRMRRDHRRTMRADVLERTAYLRRCGLPISFPSISHRGFFTQLLYPWSGHGLAYVPIRQGQKPRRLIVALHGHGGNALFWLDSWRNLAEQLNAIVIAPTFSYGPWERPESIEAVRASINYAHMRWPIDGNQIVIAGISQGGCGVTRSAGLATEAIIYLSPVIEPELMLKIVPKNLKTVVTLGGQDLNIRSESVRSAVRILVQAGHDIRIILDESEDHYFWFRHQYRLSLMIANSLCTTI